MIKLIGAILLIGGTAAWGISGVLRLRARCRSLTSITHALGVMQSEICDRLTPMPELLSQLGEEAEYPARLLYKNAENKLSTLGNTHFGAIWRQAVTATPELLLTAPEEAALVELGTSLGKYNVEEQKNAISYTRRRLEEYVKRAEIVRETDSKVRAFLGVASGIFAVVLFI